VAELGSRKTFFYTMPITLNSLKKLGSAYFRVDWIGNVVSRSLKAAATPSVSVVFSPRQSFHNTRPDRNLPQVELIIPIAYLRLLRVGDIWHKGLRVREGDGEQLCFTNIEINRETVDVKPVGLPIAVDDELCFPLPFDQYCSHRLHTGSYAARVQIDETTFLLVPCIELIRFYFGSSGALLSRLFSGAVAGKNLYDSARMNSKGIAHVKLSKGIPGVAAATVARIALDHHAARAANWIIKSGVSAAANSASYYPATTFPFEGKTTLTVVGKWVDAQGYGVFVVDRLMSCTHPFPFRSMYYELHPSQKRQASQGGNPSDGSRKCDRNEEEKTMGADELTEGAVNAALTVASVFVDENAEAFPDLHGKPIRRIAVSKLSSSAAAGLKSVPLAVGPRERSGFYRGVDVSMESEAVNRMSGPIAILAAVEILRKVSEFDVWLNDLPGLLPGNVSPFSRIKYVRQSDQHKFPIIVGTRLKFISPVGFSEFLLLTYESSIEARNWHTAMISAETAIPQFAIGERWVLNTLWAAGRYFVGINKSINPDTMVMSHVIPTEQAIDPPQLAEILQQAMVEFRVSRHQ
jgi:hypothetical protein